MNEKHALAYADNVEVRKVMRTVTLAGRRRGRRGCGHTKRMMDTVQSDHTAHTILRVCKELTIAIDDHGTRI